MSVIKKRKTNSRSEGKPLQYPKSSEIKWKTFQLKYNGKLSLIAKFILNSFQNILFVLLFNTPTRTKYFVNLCKSFTGDYRNS